MRANMGEDWLDDDEPAGVAPLWGWTAILFCVVAYSWALVAFLSAVLK